MQIELNGISKIYKSRLNSVQALKNINLYIDKGELVAIVGKSGSGKSTLLHILGLSDTQTSGEYILDGTNISKLSEKKKSILRNTKIGHVLQDFALVNQMTVYDNIALPLLISNSSGSITKQRVNAAARSVQISDLLKKRANQLSGGQKQRVAIARALAMQPQIILADEPTGALDINTGNEIIRLLLKLNDQGTTVIIVTHDLEIASMCKRVIKLTDGQIVKS